MGDDKTTVIVTLTRGGKKLGKELKESLNGADLFCPVKFKTIEGGKGEKIFYYDLSLRELTVDLFQRYDNIIYIMSLGIVVRIIASYLESKKVDPAVITIDETGKNVISTLSGHLGGANQLTEEIARVLNANPVITTATDCQNKVAIDLLAQKMGCVIKPFSNLKLANSAIVNNNPLNIFSDYYLPILEEENIEIYPLSQLGSKLNEKAFSVIISNKNYDFKKEYLQLIPRNITVGIGCRRGVAKEKIEEAVTKSLKKLNLRESSIKNLATIDLKADEAGLLAYSEEKSFKLDIIERVKIKKADLENISYSEFVKKTVGVAGVCEPAALLSSNHGKLILKKSKFDKVTIALVEEEIDID